MEVNVQQVVGNWNLGYSLDKHTLRSVYIGDNQWGHPEFDTTRSEVGEALFQLKYRADFDQVTIIARQMYASFRRPFASASFVIPMPPSRARARQPVVEVAREFARLMGIPCDENVLTKRRETPQMKDIDGREAKVQTLVNAFAVNDCLGAGPFDVIIVDDLFDTGSSLEAATTVLRTCRKIRSVYVAAITRKHNA